MSKRNTKHRPLDTIIASQIQSKMKFRVEEAYKIARTNLSFSILKDGCKKIVVTGSVSREGKSTTAVNLAVSLAQQLNTKVLLVDCDLRKPRINQFFKQASSPGLTDYLSHSNTIEEVIRNTDIENLKIIFSGTIPPNPSELLGSENMKDLVMEMERVFDYIILDSPPLNVVIDALPLAKLADGVVLSSMQGYSTHPEISKTIEALRKVDAKILGFVLNKHKAEGKNKYNSQYYYYKKE